MVILGVDTSLRSTGYAVLETRGSSLAALDYGTVANPQTLPLSGCLAAIYARIAELVLLHRPDAVAVEKVIYAKNARTMLVLGEARGAVVAAAATAGVNVYEYEPRRVKSAVCGNGMAEKGQVQRMVRVLVNLPLLPQNDAADAMAIAIAHTHSYAPESI